MIYLESWDGKSDGVKWRSSETRKIRAAYILEWQQGTFLPIWSHWDGHKSILIYILVVFPFNLDYTCSENEIDIDDFIVM